MNNRRRSRRPNIDGRRPSTRAAFTLLELLLVLAILTILVGIVGTQIGGALSDSKISTTEIQATKLKENVSMYLIRTQNLPEKLDQLVDGPSDGAKKATWRPLIEKVPQDGWQNDFIYTKKGESFEIRSAGPDGSVNTDDDIVATGG